MEAQFVGQDRIGAGGTQDGGTSLAVRQFLALVRGERAVQRPLNPFVTLAVQDLKQYCTNCFGVRRFDVVLTLGKIGLLHCRCCGAAKDIRGKDFEVA